MFRFRLQRLLELREEAEQAKARMFAAAQDAADAARRHREAIADLQTLSRTEYRLAHLDAPRIGHLQQLGVVLQSLDERLATAVESEQAAEAVVTAAQEALAQAARDRRVLDRLKERHLVQWRAAEAQRDRVLMDDIALGRFTRSAEVKAMDLPADAPSASSRRQEVQS